MAGKWPYKCVEEIALKIAMGPFGSSIKVETFTDSGIPIISGQHLRESELTDSKFNFITEAHADSLKNANVQRGDVVFTHAGNIGQVAFIPDNSAYQRYVISQRQFYLRSNRALMLPEFITYYFKSPEGQHRLLANANQVGVPSIARPSSYLKTIEVPVPSIEEQQVIVRNIKTLDAKIRSNGKINQTLEAIAQAIFKSWFVDFDPVTAKIAAKHEGRDPLRAAMSTISGKPDAELDDLPPEQYDSLAATAALFPDEMEESELGEIPRGWEIESIGNYLQTISKTFPLKTTDEAIFLNTGDIQDGVFLHKTKSKVATLPGQAKKSIQLNDILYSEIRPENKRFAYVYFDADDYVVSTKLMVLRSKGAIDPKFLYFLLRQQNVIDQLQLLAESRSGTFPQITFDVLSSIEFVAPKDHQATNFFAETIVSQVMKVTNSNIAENSKLAVLRDTLLPKLLSGELSVRVATELAESAGTA